MQLQLKTGDHIPKKAMVVSHERSGTHFLMNTLAANFKYIAQPWINLDVELGLNFHSAPHLHALFRKFYGAKVLNIVKSHHAVGFFEPFLEDLLQEYFVFYIYRDARDVMCSYHRIVQGLEWDEGPRMENVGAFMRAAPRGASLRYQKETHQTVLQRWKAHVSGWLGHSHTENPGFIAIRFEELNLDFENTVMNISERIGADCAEPIRPNKTTNVVAPGSGKTGGYQKDLTEEDLAWMRNESGDLMGELGYV